MAKVTKSAAKSVAELMANNAIDPKLKELNNIVSNLLTKYAKESVPIEVMKLFINPKFSMYFQTKKYTKFEHESLHENWSSFRLSELVPKKENENGYVQVSKIDYEFLLEKIKEISNLVSNKYNLIKKIELTLLNLGTTKRVEEEFPEAFIFLKPLISEKTITTISLPLKDLINELKSYN